MIRGNCYEMKGMETDRESKIEDVSHYFLPLLPGNLL